MLLIVGGLVDHQLGDQRQYLLAMDPHQSKCAMARKAIMNLCNPLTGWSSVDAGKFLVKQQTTEAQDKINNRVI